MSRKRYKKRKPWDNPNYDEVTHYPDGSWSAKARCTDEQAKEFLAAVTHLGLGLEKDEKGYFYITGELVCSAD